MKMKFVICASLTIAAVPVLASFELMLLPGTDGRIYRYDPVNNISLGSYRAGLSLITSVATTSSGLSYSSYSGGSAYMVHEYSTGNALPIYSGPLQPLSTDIVGNTLYVLDAFGNLRRKDLVTGTTLTDNLASNVTWRTGAVLGDRYYAAGVNSANNIVLQSVNLTTNAVSAVVSSTANVSGLASLGKMAAYRNSNFNSAEGMLTYLTSGGALNTFRFDINTDGSISSVAPVTAALTNFSSANIIPATMASHDGFKIVGQDSAVLTNYRVNHYGFTSGILTPLSDTFAATGGIRTSYALFQPALIVAPEPGTMIALGLGLAGILKRRNRKPSA